MKSLIVTYDLCDPGRDYCALYQKLKSYSGWAKITESCWLLKTDETCVQVINDIKSVVDKNDRLFVTESAGVSAWFNVICDNGYLKNNL